MRPVLELVSILAVGFFLATVLGATAVDSLPVVTDLGGKKIDYGSLGLGLILGVLISNVARVGWSDIPRRVAAYLVAKRGVLQLAFWGVAFAAVLILY